MAKVFEIPKDFLQKVLWSGFGAEATTFNAHKKHGNAVLSYLSKYVGTAVRGPCFKRLFEKSPLKIRKNFPVVVTLYSGKDFKVLTPRKYTLYQIRYFLFLSRQRRGTVSTYSMKPYHMSPPREIHNLFSQSLLCNHPNKL